MTLTRVRLVGGPLRGSLVGLEEPLPGRVAGEALQDMVEALPALRAALAGGDYVRTPGGREKWARPSYERLGLDWHDIYEWREA